MKVYVVMKDWWDGQCGGEVFVGAYSTRTGAEKFITQHVSELEPGQDESFEIEEATLRD